LGRSSLANRPSSGSRGRATLPLRGGRLEQRRWGSPARRSLPETYDSCRCWRRRMRSPSSKHAHEPEGCPFIFHQTRDATYLRHLHLTPCRSSSAPRQSPSSPSGARGRADDRAVRASRPANHHVPEASMAMGLGVGSWAKNDSRRAGSFAKQCWVSSPSAVRTAICDMRLWRSTPTCTMLLASCLRAVPAPLRCQPISG
jgi:hypothetical protein